MKSNDEITNEITKDRVDRLTDCVTRVVFLLAIIVIALDMFVWRP